MPRIALVLLGLAVLASLPFVLDPYWLRIATGILMWAGLACAWNIIGGYAGYISFGHSAFFGIGAYAAGILMGNRYGLPFGVALLVGVVAASVVAALIGWPTLRLRGAYFAIATWAFAEMLLQLANILDITGGTAGLTLPPLLDERFFFYAMLVAAVVTYGASYFLLERSRFGYRLKAVRDSEVAAESLGINTTLVKIQAFVLSAAIPAAFGSIYAYWITFINPTSVLGAYIADQMVVMVLLGGLGHFWGPAIGAVSMYLVNRIIWTEWANLGAYIADQMVVMVLLGGLGHFWGPAIGAVSMYLVNRIIWTEWANTTAYIAILGAVIAAVVLFLPDGLVSLWPGTRRLRLVRALARQMGRLSPRTGTAEEKP